MLNETILSTLRSLGMTDIESRVYLAVIDLSDSKVNDISKRSGIHRRTVYDALERLASKGLIKYIVENKIRRYNAVDPSVLFDLLKERERSVSDILPTLSERFKFNKKREQTLFFKGKDGLKSVLDEQLKESKEILIIGASLNSSDILQGYLEFYNAERIKRKISVKALFNIEAKNKLSKIPLLTVKYLPKNFSEPAAINIYNDKISIILWSRDNPFAIVIENKDIASSYRKYFSLLWSISSN